MRDLEYEEIRAMLSVSEPLTRTLISRRAVLKALGAGIGISMIPAWLIDEARAALPTNATTGGVLVVIQLGGGNDGLNTVVPVADGNYQKMRSGLAIDATKALPLTTTTALNPALVNLHARFKAGKVAIVQGVGYRDPDLSHFQSMATWMAGWGPGGAPKSGWLGRYFDGLQRDALNGITIGSSVPLHMSGMTTAATSIPGSKDQIFGIADAKEGADQTTARLFASVKRLGATKRGLGERYDTVAATLNRSMDFGVEVARCYAAKADNSEEFASHMALCANLINANMGVRVLSVELGSFDTHSNQQWQHNDLLTKLDKGIAAFYTALQPAHSKRVAMMTFSEFGRRAQANGGGTDHGTAGPLFVIGDAVKGGIVGRHPLLSDLDSSGNLKASVPFHAVYGTVLDKWLGADSKQILGQQFETLPLFRTATAAAPVARPVVTGA